MTKDLQGQVRFKLKKKVASKISGTSRKHQLHSSFSVILIKIIKNSDSLLRLTSIGDMGNLGKLS